MNKNKNLRWQELFNLTKEWKCSKNYPLNPEGLSAGSHKKVWWECTKNSSHQWNARIKDRVLKGSGCPFCAGRKADLSNCLQTTHPNIAREWHSVKNIFSPLEITANSNRKVWWICSKDSQHEWQTTCANRTRARSGCPYCTGKIATKLTSLEYKFPELSREWHPTKNGVLTAQHVTAGSAKKVWWLCSQNNNHEWQAMVINRTNRNKTSCPMCSKNRLSKFSRNKDTE